LSCCNQHP